MFDNTGSPTVPDALAEINLLAIAAVGGWGAHPLDRRIAYHRALNAANVGPDSTVHTLYVVDRQVVGDSWQQVTPEGKGLNNDAVGAAARATAIEVRVDLEERSGTGRLRQLISELAGVLSPESEAVMRNALGVAERDDDAIDLELVRVAEGVHKALTSDGQPTATDVVNWCYSIEQRQWQRRAALAIDAAAAAAMLLGANVPRVCGSACTDAAGQVAMTRELLAAAAWPLAHGDYRQMKTLIEHAVALGHLAQLAELADDLLCTAEGFRDDARHAPADPLEYAHRLFKVVPHAFAAFLLSTWTRPLLSEDDASTGRWAARATQAEEVTNLAHDGLTRQYVDWADSGLTAPRAAIGAAIANHKALEADLMFRTGEQACWWPLSYRDFLMGDGAAPTIDLNRKETQTP